MNACADTVLLVSPGVAWLLVGALGTLALAWWASSLRDFPGRGAFRGFLLASLLWVLAAGAEMLVADAACKIRWAAHAWPAIIATPTMWAIFLWRYVHGRVRALRPAQWVPLAGVPLVMWVAALTNPSHGLVYGPGTAAVSDLPGAPVRYEHGPVFWLAAAYVYGLMLVAVLAVWRAARRAQGPLRGLYLRLLGMTFVPWVVNAGYVLFGLTLFGFDPTPFSFVVTLLLIVWAVTRHGLFDLVPVAREVLLDALPDPVLVVDRTDRVVAANPAAQQLGASRAGGQPLSAFGSVGGPIAHALDAGPAYPLVEAGGQAFELHRVPLLHRAALVGQLLYLRDVTQRVQTERRLQDALAERETQVRTITALHGQLEEQALRDPLTGLYNRRHLQDLFSRESARSLRAHQPVAVAMIDIDHFKQINDTHGHAAGDEVLQAVARRLEGMTRASDVVFRLGGEEFLVLWPSAPMKVAADRMGELCEDMQRSPVPTTAGPLSCTVSIGVAEWPRHGNTLEEVLQAVDGAMYAAKSLGRNRVHGA